jgi:hypothetical protein
MPEWQKTDVLMICIHQSVFDAKIRVLPKSDLEN